MMPATQAPTWQHACSFQALPVMPSFLAWKDTLGVDCSAALLARERFITEFWSAASFCHSSVGKAK